MDLALRAAMEGLKAASEGNEQEVIRWLEEDHPTSVEAWDGALIVAVSYGQLGVARLLVQRGANINATGAKEMTVLHFAAHGGHDQIVAFLLDEGAQTNSRNDTGATPLIQASAKGHMAVVRLLVQHLGTQELHARDFEGRTALHCATEKGHCEVVALLLSKGAQASTRDDDGETPLISASRCGYVGLVHLLFQHMGASGLEDRDDEGWTALLNAAYWGQDEILRFLLLAGGDHTITDKEGRTARALAEEEDEEQHNDMHKEGKVRCVAVLEWWDGELKRRAVLHRATCLNKAYTMRQDMPTSQVPSYLEARVAAGHAVPSVEVMSPQSQKQQQDGEEAGTSGKRHAAGEGDDAQGEEAGEKEEERYAMLEFVVKALNEALVTELLEGFH